MTTKRIKTILIITVTIIVIIDADDNLFDRSSPSHQNDYILDPLLPANQQQRIVKPLEVIIFIIIIITIISSLLQLHLLFIISKQRNEGSEGRSARI